MYPYPADALHTLNGSAVFLKGETALEPTVYTVATAHLDTIWNWSFETTVRDYLPKTLRKNFDYFERFPDYRFSFEGAYRYELMQAYYPAEFEKLKAYVKAGKWNVCGSAYENGDVNIPSPEALIRNILYGNAFFEKTFGVRSTDVFLPDCFGFGWALPSVMAHCGLLGFTTQKLSWGSAYGVPFDVGRWVGVDGETVFAAVNMGNYTRVFCRIRTLPFVRDKLRENMARGLPFTAVFHGVGDRGGAPLLPSVTTLQTEINQNDMEEVQVRSAAADDLFRDLSKKENADYAAKLPVWNNELVMTNHGAGCYTSRAISKRWNAKNENLAFAAEELAAAADVLGALPYDRETLTTAWKRVIAHQFHDDLTGTALQREYRRSWNDYAVSMNQFADCYAASAAAVIDRMDTAFCKGTPVVVQNPTAAAKARVVTLDWADETPVQVFDNRGASVPVQQYRTPDGKAHLAFSAVVAPCGLRVFDVRKTKAPAAFGSVCSANETALENDLLRVQLDENGCVSSIYAKQLDRELLSAPLKLDFLDDKASAVYPAWELRYSDVSARVKGEAELVDVTPLYAGCCKSAVRVRQRYGESAIETVISLEAGSAAVGFQVEIDWHSQQTLLKHRFTFTAENARARYDLGLGSIERRNNSEKLYEVPAQKWAALTDASGDFGVGVVSDSKRGWDKPDNRTLRLTALHTPKENFRPDSMQSLLDLGLNRYGFAVCPFTGAAAPAMHAFAEAFTQPLTAFVTDKHKGALASAFSLLSLDNENVALRAVKKAERGENLILRLNELSGAEQTVTLRFAFPVTEAHLCSGCEDVQAALTADGEALTLTLPPFAVRTVAVRLEAEKLRRTRDALPLELPLNTVIFSEYGAAHTAFVPEKDYALPLEELPQSFLSGGVRFETVREPYAAQALFCAGQTVALPEGTKAVTFVAASLCGDADWEFLLDGAPKTLRVQSLEDRVGGWDLVDLGDAAFLKPDPVALVFSHTRGADGEHIADQKAFFRYTIETNGAKTLTLPQHSRLLILCAAVRFKKPRTFPLRVLTETVNERTVDPDAYRGDARFYRAKKLKALWRQAF